MYHASFWRCFWRCWMLEVRREVGSGWQETSSSPSSRLDPGVIALPRLRKNACTVIGKRPPRFLANFLLNAHPLGLLHTLCQNADLNFTPFRFVDDRTYDVARNIFTAIESAFLFYKCFFWPKMPTCWTSRWKSLCSTFMTIRTRHPQSSKRIRLCGTLAFVII